MRACTIGRRLLAAAGTAALLAVPAAHAQEAPGLQRVEGRPPAPDFAREGLDGKTYRLSDLRGKVVLINFWASWCPPCRQEIPSMQRLYEDLQGQPFQVLAVNVGEREPTVFSFARGELDTELTFPILLDPDAGVIDKYPAKGLPTSFLVDRQGRIAYKAVGGRDMTSDAFAGTVRKLLRSGAADTP
ncbi:MAG TPA: TlpA disulfide reductase family protein [Gammaproteobacteria bacterium]|nr:TlpA disulfide reductase family protein [Gammaproteobacteria bacterium]